MSLKAYGSVAVLVLAGGRGERLDLLTIRRSKPAVPFGGNFRIIDFVLSNCFKAGFSNVSILTQYLPRSLEDHVSFGRSWDLDRLSNGLTWMHPFMGLDKANWYGGTANALYENLAMLEAFNADHYLILSGDHIYRMDYQELVARHEASMSQVTVAVRPVPLETAHHFGIFEENEQGGAASFEEKPAEPRSNLASMGIYVVRREYLLSQLRERGPAEPHLDFGKDLVPRWVADGDLALYPYDGYWLDVGTLESYFKAHQDLLGADPLFKLDTADWPILTNSPPRSPLQMAAAASLSDSLVSEGCRIKGYVERSILGPGVIVEDGAEVVDSILMENVRVGRGSKIVRSILDKRVIVGEETSIGAQGNGEINTAKPQALFSGITLLGKGSQVPSGFTLGRNVRWGDTGDGELPSKVSGKTVPDGISVI